MWNKHELRVRVRHERESTLEPNYNVLCAVIHQYIHSTVLIIILCGARTSCACPLNTRMNFEAQRGRVWE